MSEKDQLCRFCGSLLLKGDCICPNCGAQVEDMVERSTDSAVEPEQIITYPTTIEELQKYCSQHGMPLMRMRFFIGEDYKQPKAFGIYRDGNEVVVYKNKDTGERAIRYRGTDEAHGVSELFEKLLSECHNRGIYPDGQDADRSFGGSSVDRGYKQQTKASTKPMIIGIIVFVVGVALLAGIVSSKNHKNDGYYQVGNVYYYRYGSDWTYYDDYSDSWTYTSFPEDDYESYYIDDSYSSSWGISNVRDSSVWDDWHTSDSYSSSYDSWDSSSTDWSSDW